jgi:hypothetical protein
MNLSSLAKPDKIEACKQGHEGNGEETDKSQDEVPFQKKTDAEKACHYLENNDNDDGRSEKESIFPEQ